MSKKFSALKNFKFTGDLQQKLALILSAASILVLFLPINALFAEGMQIQFFSLFVANPDMSLMSGIIATIMRFGFVFLMLATAVLSILSLVKPKEAANLFPTATFLFLVGCAGYSFSVMACSLSLSTFAIDPVTFVFSLGATAVYFLVCLKNNEEFFFNGIAQFALTLGYTVLTCLALGSTLAEEGFVAILALLCTVFIAANMAFECLRLRKDGNNEMDRMRFFGAAGAAGLLFIANLLVKNQPVTPMGIAFPLIAILFALAESELVYAKYRKEKKEKAYVRPKSAMEAPIEPINAAAVAMDEPTPPPFERPMPMPSPMAAAVGPVEYNGFKVEEYAEAVPYEGGPVAGVEMAEEVNPTFSAYTGNGRVETAGYDYYNSKSFDPFIATLDAEERNQFTELFILKYKGVMPEIPDYQVGGDNKEFFRLIFIYLGQYRDRIPSGLLNKIYNFSVRL